jgi:hypothetical protein
MGDVIQTRMQVLMAMCKCSYARFESFFSFIPDHDNDHTIAVYYC